VVTEFALSVAYKLQAARMLKMVVKIPWRHAAKRRLMAAWRRQDSSFAVDTEWGDKFRTESGSFIAV
jgi:hypothetical protein